MNSGIVLTLRDVGMIVLWALGCGVLLYILLILKKVYESIKLVKDTIADNRPHIDKTLEEIPGITQNVSTISGEVAYVMEAFHGTIGNVADTTESVTSVVKDNQDIVDRIAGFFNIISKAKALYERYFGHDDDDRPDFDRPSEHQNYDPE